MRAIGDSISLRAIFFVIDTLPPYRGLNRGNLEATSDRRHPWPIFLS